MTAIRRASIDDLPALAALRSRAILSGHGACYTPEQLTAWAASPLSDAYAEQTGAGAVLVACRQSEIVGFAALTPGGAAIDAVFVAPSAMRQGVGRALVRAIEAEASARQQRRLHLFATLNAVRFFESTGYRQLEVTRFAHPCNIFLQCVCMERRLLMRLSRRRVTADAGPPPQPSQP